MLNMNHSFGRTLFKNKKRGVNSVVRTQHAKNALSSLFLANIFAQAGASSV